MSKPLVVRTAVRVNPRSNMPRKTKKRKQKSKPKARAAYTTGMSPVRRAAKKSGSGKSGK